VETASILTTAAPVSVIITLSLRVSVFDIRHENLLADND